MPKPVVAAVRGMAAGAGAGLAFLADFRIGGPKTGFLMAFANVGLAADTAASWTLPRLVGHAKATELLMLAEPVGAAEACRLGLLTTLVDDDDDVLPAAQELAARLAAGPTVAYGQIKRELLAAASATLAEALEVEADAQAVSGCDRAITASRSPRSSPSRPRCFHGPLSRYSSSSGSWFASAPRTYACIASSSSAGLTNAGSSRGPRSLT